jgi:hypothetical protein
MIKKVAAAVLACTVALVPVQKAQALSLSSAQNVIGLLKKYGIISDSAADYLNSLYKDILTLEKYAGLKFPPDFNVGIAPDVVLGGRPLKTLTDTTQPYANLDATGVNQPDQSLRLYCLQHMGDPKCKKMGVTNVLDTESFVGATNKVFENKTSAEITKDIEKNVEAIAGTDLGDQAGRQQEKELIKAFPQRNAFMNGATLTRSTVPLGKEYADKLPPDVRKKYNFLATQELAKEVYVKSLQRRLQIHFQKILALKHLIDKVCNAKAETPKPSCSASSINLSSSAVRTESGTELAMGTRFSCWPYARWVVSVLGTRISSAEQAVITSLARDTAQIVHTVQQESCAVRNRIWTEENANRNLMKTLACVQMRIELESLMLQLDILEAQTATTAGVLTQVQNGNYQDLNKSIKEVEERGYELMH